MDKPFANFSKDIFIYFCIFLVLGIAYSPAIFGYYAHSDDYYLFWGPNDSHDFNLIFFTGRFLCALIWSFLVLFVHTVSDLNVLRFLSVVCVSSLAFICYFWVRNYFTLTINAVFFVLCIFTLPPFQVLVSWSCCVVLLVAVVLAAVAACLARREFNAERIGALIKTKSAVLAVLILI